MTRDIIGGIVAIVATIGILIIIYSILKTGKRGD
jgi:hypothetical protein